MGGRRGETRGKPDRERVWSAFAARGGGDVERDKKGQVKSITFAHGEREVVVDRYTVSTGNANVTYTRARGAFDAQVPFRCKVWKEGFFSRVGKKLGMQDLKVGRPTLDRDFVVQSDGPGHARSLLAGSRVGELLERDPKLQYEVKKRKQSRKDPDDAPDAEVVVQIAEVVRDGDRLDIMLALCRETLDAVVRIGVALPPSGRHDL